MWPPRWPPRTAAARNAPGSANIELQSADISADLGRSIIEDLSSPADDPQSCLQTSEVYYGRGEGGDFIPICPVFRFHTE